MRLSAKACVLAIAVGFLSVLAALRAWAAGGTPAPFVVEPYLQHLSLSSVDIRVELDPPSAATVEIQATSGSDATRRTVSASAGGVQNFHVDGLVPETRYRYVVRAGDRVAPGGEFVTAPKDDSTAPYAFVVYGDTRSNPEVHAAVVKAIRSEAFEFLINTGDTVVSGGDRSLWREFFSIEKDLLRSHCVFACIGNHELVEDLAATNYLAYLGPNEPGSTVPYGSFRWANSRFFLLNAFQDWGHGELAWLLRELDKADSEPGLVWRVVVVHQSPWSSGRHGGDARMVAAGVPEMLAGHKVDLLLAGHDHIYERGASKGLKYIVSGGAGAPLYKERTPSDTTRHFDATYNYVRVAVAGDAIRAVVKRPDGSTVETCGFRRGEDWDCDAKPNAPSPAASAPPSSGAPTPERSPSPSRCACRTVGALSTASSPSTLGLVALFILFVRRRPAASSPRA